MRDPGAALGRRAALAPPPPPPEPEGVSCVAAPPPARSPRGPQGGAQEQLGRQGHQVGGGAWGRTPGQASATSTTKSPTVCPLA